MGSSPDYRRALALLAARDRPDTLDYVTRTAQRVCGALVAVLLVFSSTNTTPMVARALGRSARRVGRKLAELGAADLGTQVRLADAAGYRMLVAPVTAPAGAIGALGVGVRAPRGFSAPQRRHLRALADIASVVVQLAELRQEIAEPPQVAGDGQRPLSRRERQVVTLLLAGASVKEASAHLGLSPRTVETYLQRLKVRERQPRLHALLAQLVRQGRI